MSEKQLDLLIRIRDSYAMALDAITEYLQSLAPPESGSAPKEPYNMERIRWSSAEGPRGVYEKTDDVNSADYKALLADLNLHKDKMRAQGYFVWSFEDKKTIARKKV